jgi:radical SAM protein with 4Fe4S-binding SPASM domain
MTTNAVLLNPERARGLLPHMRWIKASFNAGTPETYAAVHGTRPADFHKALDNLQAAAELRRANGWACTLGLQALLLPENEQEMETLALLARERGLDYFVVKPYSQHPQSETTAYQGVTYEHCETLGRRLQALATEDFRVLFRWRTMRKWDARHKPYQRCLGLPFWSYLDAAGTVWGCSVYLNDERFRYGNVYEQTFSEIWEGAARRKSLAWVQEEMDARDCRLNCRLDEINRYLWQLRHPHDHVNFI